MLKLVPLLLALGLAQAKPYDEVMAKKLLPLASAAYAYNPQNCVGNAFKDGKVIERYEPICDSSGTDTCSGYLALIPSEKAIVVAFRGTTTDLQLKLEKIAAVLPKDNFEGMGRINTYFHDAFYAIWNAGMGTRFSALANTYKDYDLWVTGHSLGAALSTLASAKITKFFPKYTKDKSYHYNYGQPRIGDKKFSDSHAEILPDFYRLSHSLDLITMLPDRKYGFIHHLREVWYNNTMSPGSTYTFCDIEDDPNCARTIPDDCEECWTDHRYYFGIKVTEYGPLGCKTPIP